MKRVGFLVGGLLAACEGADEKHILSATYGVGGCVGLDTGDQRVLAERNCTVVNGDTSAISENTVRGLRLAGRCTGLVKNGDAMPITFSAPVDPKTVKGDSFRVTLNTGDVVNSICATALPAVEDNEMQTFATMGYYGDGFADTKYAVKVEVVDDVTFTDGTSAKGLTFDIPKSQRYSTDSPYIVQAEVLPFSTDGERNALIPRGVYPNHCQQLYGKKVTHRVRIVMNGGSTLDGINSILPNQTNTFELYDASGARITDPIVGMADLGNKATGSFGSYTHDGDNFFDICLDDTKGSVDSIASVHLPCSDVKLYLPSGRTPCKANSLPVGRPTSQVQPKESLLV